MIGGLWLAGAAPLRAHHAFAAEFDAKKPIHFEGTITKMEWTNPHVWPAHGREEAGRLCRELGRSKRGRRMSCSGAASPSSRCCRERRSSSTAIRPRMA
jgi:hypothetical protein